MEALQGGAAGGWERRLDELAETARQAARAAASETALAVAETARQLAPRQTGALRESITVECTDTGEGGEARVLAGAPHAAAVELGLGGRKPSPFLYPALAANRGTGLEAARRVLERGGEVIVSR